MVALTFDFEVMTSKAVRLKVEEERRVGLIQEQVDPGHLDPVPFKHRTQNLSGKTRRGQVQPHGAAGAPWSGIPLTSGFSFSWQVRSQC